MGAASVSEYVASLNEEQRRHVSAFIDFMGAEYPQLTPKISSPPPPPPPRPPPPPPPPLKGSFPPPPVFPLYSFPTSPPLTKFHAHVAAGEEDV